MNPLKPRFLPICLASLLAASHLLPAAKPGLSRSGDFWVETTNGSEAVAEGEQLKITSIGDIVVHGTNRAEVEYVVKRRVDARSEAEARDRLSEAGVSLTRQGRYLRLAIDDSTGAVELQVSVPRKLRALLVGTESGSVDVSDFGGSVVIQSGAGNARLGNIGGSVDVSTAGGTLRLGEIGGWAKAVTDAGDITVDSIAGEARLESGGGDITVQKAGSNLRAITAGGRVRIGQAAGAVIASSGGGGMIEIGKAGGSVTARNGAGPILVGSAGGTVQCASASGALKVGPTAGTVRLTTGSGNVAAQFLGETLPGDAYLSTGSGDITVFLPSNLRVTVRAQNEGAAVARSIVSDFPGLRIQSSSGTVFARGALNGGGPLLRIQGTSGTIWIKKK